MDDWISNNNNFKVSDKGVEELWKNRKPCGTIFPHSIKSIEQIHNCLTSLSRSLTLSLSSTLTGVLWRNQVLLWVCAVLKLQSCCVRKETGCLCLFRWCQFPTRTLFVFSADLTVWMLGKLFVCQSVSCSASGVLASCLSICLCHMSCRLSGPTAALIQFDPCWEKIVLILLCLFRSSVKLHMAHTWRYHMGNRLTDRTNLPLLKSSDQIISSHYVFCHTFFRHDEET